MGRQSCAAPRGLLTRMAENCPIGQELRPSLVPVPGRVLLPNRSSCQTKIETGSARCFLIRPFRRAGAVALGALLLGTAPAALFAETPADTIVLADAIDDIVSLDPHEAYEFSGLDVVNNTYDGLVELDPTRPGELVPGLAESWSVAADGLTYTFKMKAGVTFASGNPVTADDAAYSLQRAVKLNRTPAFILNQSAGRRKPWTA